MSRGAAEILTIVILGACVAFFLVRYIQGNRLIRQALVVIEDLEERLVRAEAFADLHECSCLRDLIAPGKAVSCQDCGAIWEAWEIISTWHEHDDDVMTQESQYWTLKQLPVGYR